jgi:hypothetical protein
LRGRAFVGRPDGAGGIGALALIRVILKEIWIPRDQPVEASSIPSTPSSVTFTASK